MNVYLSGRPITLPARNKNRFAIYTKVFVVSNYSLDSLYKKERENGKQPSFEGFLRRIDEIIYMPERNVHIWQKGRPSEKTVKTLLGQGAMYTIEGETVEQITARIF